MFESIAILTRHQTTIQNTALNLNIAYHQQAAEDIRLSYGLTFGLNHFSLRMEYNNRQQRLVLLANGILFLCNGHLQEDESGKMTRLTLKINYMFRYFYPPVTMPGNAHPASASLRLSTLLRF